MAEITTHYARDAELTLFVVDGCVLADELIAVIEAHYGSNPTSITIWDLWEADLSELDMPALIRVSDCAQRFAEQRPNPKTIFVVKRAQEKPLVKLYKKIAEFRGSPVTYDLQPTLTDAYESLGMADPFAERRARA